jgi:hypothetical protein
MLDAISVAVLFFEPNKLIEQLPCHGFGDPVEGVFVNNASSLDFFHPLLKVGKRDVDVDEVLWLVGEDVQRIFKNLSGALDIPLLFLEPGEFQPHLSIVS